MTLDPFLVDKRVVDRNIKNGKLDAGQYRKLLETLPDLSGSVSRQAGDAASQAPAPAAAEGARPTAAAARVETSETLVQPL
jgi:hypothetical protein